MRNASSGIVTAESEMKIWMDLKQKPGKLN